jgi:mevalonate kinase
MLGEVTPSKILLLGEYTILNGSKALAFPYWKLSGRWSWDLKQTADAVSSRASLKAFLSHPSEAYIDYSRLKKDLKAGLWFDSSIPAGFGLGSSGALVAAIFHTYGLRRGTLLEDKAALTSLEGYFHGSSSGLDPLVSLVQKPLLIHSFNEVEILQSDFSLRGFFILNTGKPRQTGPLVTIYKEKMKDPDFKSGCIEVLSKEVNFAIDEIITNDHANLFHHLWLISKLQWDFFSEMIPPEIRDLWLQGLESGDYVLKLCGAGGGGFILGYKKDPSLSSLEVFKAYEILDLEP